MSQPYITDNLPKVEEYLRANRLRDALALMQAMSEQARTVAITDDVKHIEQSYAYMLRYLREGTDDPARLQMHDALIADTYRLLDRLTRHTMAKDRPTLYYDALRYRARMRGQLPDLRTRVGNYLKMADMLSLFNIAADGSSSAGSADDFRARIALEEDIFTYIWTVYPLAGDDAEAVRVLLNDSAVPAHFRSMTVSAITLGLLEFADDERLMLLAGVYESATDVNLAMAALTGIVLALHKYSHRPMSRRLADRIAALRDLPQWQSDIAMLQLELIRARDTERINNKMRDEVIPQMLKLRPDILKKINDIQENADEKSALDENPEWEKIMDESGLRDRLKEFGELQMEGSDVMMSTFAQLKAYPFFHNVANWFRPFHTDFPEIADTMDAALPGLLSDVVEHASFLCDGDKYSLVLTLARIPESQRRLMLGQIEAQAANMAEAAAAMTANLTRRAAANNYIHNIYRFYKLFRRRGEFYDPFARPINLIAVDALADRFNNAEPLRLIAELYLKFHTYDQALEVFRRLLEHTPPSAEIFQKIGFCLERLGRTTEALAQYRQAELFDARSAWTLRRLAATARATGQLDAAAEYYSRLEQMLPDDKNVALNLGNVYAEMEMYPEAIKQYYKVNFMDERSMRPVRPLAWCLFVIGEYERSRSFFDRVLADNPTSDDYLNMGHLALAMHDMPEALSYYKLSVTTSDGSIDTFSAKLAEDEKYLIRAGIDLRSLPMLADAVFYSL